MTIHSPGSAPSTNSCVLELWLSSSLSQYRASCSGRLRFCIDWWQVFLVPDQVPVLMYTPRTPRQRHQPMLRSIAEVPAYCYNHLVGHRAVRAYDRPDGTWLATAHESNDELANDEAMTWAEDATIFLLLKAHCQWCLVYYPDYMSRYQSCHA